MWSRLMLLRTLLCLDISLTRVIWTLDSFENNFESYHEFPDYLKSWFLGFWSIFLLRIFPDNLYCFWKVNITEKQARRTLNTLSFHIPLQDIRYEPHGSMRDDYPQSPQESWASETAYPTTRLNTQQGGDRKSENNTPESEAQSAESKPSPDPPGGQEWY